MSNASLLGLCAFILSAAQAAAGVVPSEGRAPDFPPALSYYADSHLVGIWEVFRHRVVEEPLNIWVSLLFLAAIAHALCARRILNWAHTLKANRTGKHIPATVENGASPIVRLLHLLAEVEVVFVIWSAPLFLLLAASLGWHPTLRYFNGKVSYEEPVFVTVMMAIAGTRPVLQFAERCLGFLASLGGGGPAAWWLTVLTVGPVLGSLVTEPAAMTISALLLAKQFYEKGPSSRFAYASLGLLFVNISVGGVLTHFAAPPVVMVAKAWNWTTPFMAAHFGWVAVLGIVLANLLYYLVFKSEFTRMAGSTPPDSPGEHAVCATVPVPSWVVATHLLFLLWSVVCAHYLVLLLGGFCCFLAFQEITREHQDKLALRSPLLVGLFLAGLVIHGGLQQWWIEPVLSRLSETPLMLGALTLTTLNDNAAITYLATLVPDLTQNLKYAVVAGAISGGGLTIIANAPNPAGQSILARFFPGGISPLGLFLGALAPTIIVACCFLLLR